MKVLSIDYHLNTQRPYAEIWADDGNKYNIRGDGTTFVVLSDDLSLPAPGTRFPAVAFEVAVWSFLIGKRQRIFETTLISIGAAVFAFILFQLLVMSSPARAEILQNFMVSALGWLGIIGVVLLSLPLTALALREFAGGVSVKYEKPSGNIAAGPIAYDMHPDILVAWDGIESLAAFNERVQHLSSQATPGKWVAIFVPGEPFGMVFIGEGRSIPIDRVNPPWQFGFPSDMLIVPPGTMFTGETAEQYRAYIARMFAYLPEWIRGEKIRIRGDQAGLTFLESIGAKAIAVCVFVLLSIPALAQPKSVAVANFLGAHVSDQPGKPGGTPVVFTFERGAPLKRTGFGNRSYTALLRSVAAYSDASFGRCVSITVGGHEVKPARYAKRKEAEPEPARASIQEPAQDVDPVRPRQYTGSVQPMPESDGFGGAGISIPDSLEMVERIEGAKGTIEEWKRKARATGSPVVAFAMYAFWNVFWMLLLPFAAICWFLAKLSAAESFATVFGRRVIIGYRLVDAHQFFSILLLIDVALCAVVGLLYFYCQLVLWDVPVYVSVAVLFFVTWVAYCFSKWLIPNIKDGSTNADTAAALQLGYKQRPGINP